MELLTQRHFCFFRNNTGLEAQKPAPVFSATPLFWTRIADALCYIYACPSRTRRFFRYPPP